MFNPKVTCYVESREQAERGITKGTAKTRGEWLAQNIGGSDVINALRSVNGAVSVAMNKTETGGDSALHDLLRTYNGADIAVDLWANLPDEDGYWVHAGNVPEARAGILEMVNDLERAGIEIRNIGLDLEMPYAFLANGFNPRAWWKTAPWKFSQPQATDELQAFAEEVLGQSNYGVATYEIPLADFAPCRRLLGIPKAPVIVHPKYSRVGLTYTSITPGANLTEGVAKWYIRKFSTDKGRIPALGIVSSSKENPGRDIDLSNLLYDKNLRRDVKAALAVSPDEMYVFALNGIQGIERVREAVRLAA